MTDDTNPSMTADLLAPGRAEWMRAATASLGGDGAGVTQVLADLSLLHPAAWQTTLTAGLNEYVEMLLAIHHGDESAALAWLGEAAFRAFDFADEAAERRQNDTDGQV